LPESFDLKGILTLVMQVLGLTWANIRMQAVKLLGEKVVGYLEGAFEIFTMIKDQGLGALWDFIKDQLGDLKAMVIDGIKDMVITQVIQAGIQWLIGILGGPAGAFIKAAKAIYDIVMWFINNGSQVMSLISAIIDSVSAIAGGAVSAAAKFIEEALAKAIPVVIGFLASLLGLGNLSQKIKGIIQKIQEPINKAIGWVLNKAKAFAKKVGGALGFGKEKKGKSKGAPDKETKTNEGSAGTIEKPFSMRGADHQLIVTPGPNPKVEMASNRDLLSNKIGRAVGRLMAQKPSSDPDNKFANQVTLLKQLGKDAKDLQNIAAKAGKDPKTKLNQIPGFESKFNSLAFAIQYYGDQYGVKDIEQYLEESTTVDQKDDKFKALIESATHVPPAQYSGGKHWKGNSEEQRRKNSENNGAGQFLYSMTADRVAQLERETLLTGDVKDRGNGNYHAFKTFGSPIGYANGEKAYTLRAELSAGHVHSHPR
jgi:hypothetical protein